jgi:dTMP kinase
LRPGFITLEGGEGAGKSTQAARLAAALRAHGHEVVQTREPGGAPGAEAVRGLLLGQEWDPVAECLLLFAARREHLVRLILPALARGAFVVCDRFADSTLAYQCFGHGVPRAVFDALAAVALEGRAPDLTLVLDLAPAHGLARAEARGDANRFERLGATFHGRVHAGFRAIAAEQPERCALVDASASEEGVAAAIWRLVQARFGP